VRQKLPNWTFSSNPSRITLFSQEIVVYRADIVAKLMRHAVRMPAGDLQEMSVKTILSQAHLSPLPQRLSPIYWGWDHALPIRVANIREI
jgi:DNA polymerase epsilon subunit 2